MATRSPAVAGMFYPGDPDELRGTVDDLLAGAPEPEGRVRAVVAPHAGYVYSGSTAAVAYRHLRTEGTTRVAVLGPSHRVPLDGLAAPRATAWRTPLGDVAIDVPEAVRALADVAASDTPHAPEHSLEVHVPFLQRLLPGATLAPLMVGDAAPGPVADAIGLLLDDAGTVVVISSDLSHYLPYELARRVDRDTLDQIVRLDGEVEPVRACGARPVSGLMEHARRRGLRLRELASCTSGDTAGDKDRVVGYAALALEEES